MNVRHEVLILDARREALRRRLAELREAGAGIVLAGNLAGALEAVRNAPAGEGALAIVLGRGAGTEAAAALERACEDRRLRSVLVRDRRLAGFLDRLSSRGTGDGGLEEFRRLLAELVAFAEPARAGSRARRTEFDLVPVICETVEGFRGETEAKGLSAKLRLCSPLRVRGDRAGIRRAISDLVSAAVDSTPEGTRLGVNADVEEGGKRVSVSVWDSGPCIRSREGRTLSTRFRRRPAMDRARRVLSAHEASVQVVSAEGLGTKIRFDLPAAESA